MARFLGLGYPGGPAIDRIADQGDPTAFAFPRSTPGDGYDFSFSGLKTSVVNRGAQAPRGRHRRRGRLLPPGRGGRAGGPGPWAAADVGAPPCAWPAGWPPTPCCADGSSEACAEDGIGAFLPSRALCTDNAAMVAAAGWWRLRHGGRSPLTLGADPNLRLVPRLVLSPAGRGAPVRRSGTRMALRRLPNALRARYH